MTTALLGFLGTTEILGILVSLLLGMFAFNKTKLAFKVSMGCIAITGLSLATIKFAPASLSFLSFTLSIMGAYITILITASITFGLFVKAIATKEDNAISSFIISFISSLMIFFII